MPSFRSDAPTPAPLRSLPLVVSPAWVTGAATVPLLVALAAERVVGEGLIQIGLACEEVFRGTRLPLLKAVPGTREVKGTDDADASAS